MEKLVVGNGDVPAIDAHVSLVGSCTHQHEVIYPDTVRAAGNIDHGLAPESECLVVAANVTSQMLQRKRKQVLGSTVLYLGENRPDRQGISFAVDGG